MPSEVITLMTFINIIINTKVIKRNATSTGKLLTAYEVYIFLEEGVNQSSRGRNPSITLRSTENPPNYND